MPANTTTYDEAFAKASIAAWDEHWPTAISEYRRALSERPGDIQTHAGLAYALDGSGELEAALAEYRFCEQAAPRDTAFLLHSASILKRLIRTEEAVEAYARLADLLCEQKQMGRAVDAWREVSSLEPERVDVRERLAAAFEQEGNNGFASQEMLSLARIYNRRAEVDRALMHAERALLLDGENIQARSLVSELRAIQSSSSGVGEGSPVEQARRSSLSRLAQTVFDGSPRWRGSGQTIASGLDKDGPASLLGRALDAQTHGRTSEAIELYEQIVQAGIANSEARFNLALLYQSSGRLDDAISFFEQASSDPQFALASRMAIAECYRTQGKPDAALDSYIQSLRIVDLSTVQHEQADDVIRLYELLADGYRAKGAQGDAEGFMRSLVEFLSGKGWEDKVRQVRQHIESVAETGTTVTLAEVVETKEMARVIELLEMSSEHLKQGLFSAASDEALEAIELSPNYLPAHVQVAEILERAQRLPEAREKYEMLAEAAAVRGDTPKAVAFCRHALRLAPEDVTRRTKLIDLLVRYGQVSDALGEYVRLGEVLERNGQLQKALDRYGEGLRLAQNAGNDGPAARALRGKLAESYQKALDWQNALPLFEQLSAASPSDEHLHSILAELYRRVGQEDKSDAELDGLFSSSGGKTTDKSMQVMTAMVDCFPDDVSLNIRLARSLAGAGRQTEAVERLDRLGDKLLTGGLRSSALRVIEEIIALNPPRVEDYRQLLTELSSSE